MGQTESTLFHSAGLRHLGLWILWLSVSNVCSRAHWHTACWLEAAAQDPKWQLSVLLTDTEINIWVMCWRLQERERIFCSNGKMFIVYWRVAAWSSFQTSSDLRQTSWISLVCLDLCLSFISHKCLWASHTSSYRTVKLNLQVYSPSSSITLQMCEPTRGVLDLLFELRKHPQTASVICQWGEMAQELLITSRV